MEIEMEIMEIPSCELSLFLLVGTLGHTLSKRLARLVWAFGSLLGDQQLHRFISAKKHGNIFRPCTRPNVSTTTLALALALVATSQAKQAKLATNLATSSLAKKALVVAILLAPSSALASTSSNTGWYFNS